MKRSQAIPVLFLLGLLRHKCFISYLDFSWWLQKYCQWLQWDSRFANQQNANSYRQMYSSKKLKINLYFEKIFVVRTRLPSQMTLKKAMHIQFKRKISHWKQFLKLLSSYIYKSCSLAITFRKIQLSFFATWVSLNYGFPVYK